MRRYIVTDLHQTNGTMTLRHERTGAEYMLPLTPWRKDYGWTTAQPAMLAQWFKGTTTTVYADIVTLDHDQAASVRMWCEGGLPVVEFWRVLFDVPLPRDATHTEEARLYAPNLDAHFQLVDASALAVLHKSA